MYLIDDDSVRGSIPDDRLDDTGEDLFNIVGAFCSVFLDTAGSSGVNDSCVTEEIR